MKRRAKIGELPRGLWVGKIRRADAPKRGNAEAEGTELPKGKRPWEVWAGEYYPDYYFRIRKAGLPTKLQSTNTQVYKVAVERALLVWEAAVSSKWDKLKAAVEGTKGRRAFATLGEIFQAFRAGPSLRKEEQRVVSACRLVVATAKGWRPAFGRIDEGTELARRIDGLDSGEVLTRDLVREYFRVCQGGVFQPTLRDRRHLGYNVNLNYARGLFSKRALAYKYEGVALPEVEGFMKEPYLLTAKTDLEEAMIEPEAYKAMVQAARGLLGSAAVEDRELGLVNMLLRQLGMRSGELVAARLGWLEEDGRTGVWYLCFRDRPEEDYAMKGVEPGKLPLGPELRALLVGRLREHGAGAHIVLPGGSEAAREALVRKRHNHWLKGIIGPGVNRQGNHRLRKYVATLLAEAKGVDIASQYLRHAGEAVTLKAYIARRKGRLEAVGDEFLLG